MTGESHPYYPSTTLNRAPVGGSQPGLLLVTYRVPAISADNTSNASVLLFPTANHRLRAQDEVAGHEIRSGELPGNGSGIPMVY